MWSEDGNFTPSTRRQCEVNSDLPCLPPHQHGSQKGCHCSSLPLPFLSPQNSRRLVFQRYPVFWQHMSKGEVPFSSHTLTQCSFSARKSWQGPREQLQVLQPCLVLLIHLIRLPKKKRTERHCPQWDFSQIQASFNCAQIISFRETSITLAQNEGKKQHPY